MFRLRFLVASARRRSKSHPAPAPPLYPTNQVEEALITHDRILAVAAFSAPHDTLQAPPPTHQPPAFPPPAAHLDAHAHYSPTPNPEPGTGLSCLFARPLEHSDSLAFMRNHEGLKMRLEEWAHARRGRPSALGCRAQAPGGVRDGTRGTAAATSSSRHETSSPRRARLQPVRVARPPLPGL